jgi:hypothetical protein
VWRIEAPPKISVCVVISLSANPLKFDTVGAALAQ